MGACRVAGAIQAELRVYRIQFAYAVSPSAINKCEMRKVVLAQRYPVELNPSVHVQTGICSSYANSQFRTELALAQHAMDQQRLLQARHR